MAGNIIVVNLLLAVSLLPVITAGAGICAACYCMLSLVRYGDIAPFGDFKRSFLENFKQATAIWLLLLLAGLVLAADLRFAQLMSVSYPAAGRLCVIAAGAVLLAVLLVAVWVFPVTAAFRGTWKEILRNSFAFCAGHLPASAGLLLLLAGPLFVTYGMREWMPLWAFLWCFFGFAFLLWTASHVYLRAFRPYLLKTEAEQAVADERQALADLERMDG